MHMKKEPYLHQRKSHDNSFSSYGAALAVSSLTTKVVRAIVLLCPTTHRLAELTIHHGNLALHSAEEPRKEIMMLHSR